METKNIKSYVKKKTIIKWGEWTIKETVWVRLCSRSVLLCFLNWPLSSLRSWEIRPWGGLWDSDTQTRAHSRAKPGWKS